MSNKKTAKIGASIKLRLFETIHVLLEDFQCSTIIPCLMIVFQYTQMLVIILNSFEKEIGFSFNFLLYIAPHKIGISYSYFYVFSMIGVSTICSLIIVLGMFKSYQLRGRKSLIFYCVSVYIYFFQYILFYLLICFLLDIIKISLVYKNFALFFITLFCSVKLLAFQLLLDTLFFNFSFGTKDSFARMPSYFYVILDLFRLLIFVLDVFVEGDSKSTILLMSNSCFAIVLISNFSSKLPFVKYEVTMFNFCLICIFFWINFALGLNWISNFNIISQHLSEIVFVGLILIIGNLWYYFDNLFKYIVNMNISSISSESIMEKQMRYMYQMIELSSKSKVDELMLASIIQVHIENCAKPLCVCKNRSKLYDPIHKVESDASVAIFKDPVFLKNFLLMLIQEIHERFSTSNNIQIIYTLYQLEQFENFAQVSQQLYNFQKNDQEMKLYYQICMDRISRKLTQRLGERDQDSLYAYDHIEDIFKFDKFSDRLKECIFQIIENYSIFWDLLTEKVNEVKKISVQCRNIIKLKKEIKTLLKDISLITKESNVMFFLIEFYFNYVISEPEKTTKFDPTKKKDVQLMKSFRTSNRDSTLNLFDDSCFVLEVSMNSYSTGQIFWVSKNSAHLTSFDENILCSMNVNSLMPKLISKNHNAFIHEYTKDCRTKMIGNMTPLFMLDSKKNLIAADILPKLIWNENTISAITYFKVNSDKSRVIVTENGEIDSFGENFHKISGLNFEHGFHMSNLSLFLMMPQMIVHFLPYFYGIQNFVVENFDYNFLKTTYFIVFKDLKHKMMELSRILFEQKKKEEENQRNISFEHKKDLIYLQKIDIKRRMEYCSKLHHFLAEFIFDMVEEVYFVHIDMSKNVSSRPDIQQEFWNFKISDFVNVTSDFKKENFEAQFVFLSKIDFTDEIKYSLDRYQSRHEKNLSESANENASIARSKGNKNMSVLREIINKKKIEKVEDTDLMENMMKSKATDIIRNLFAKNSDLHSKLEKSSSFVAKMIKAINIYNSKKNSKIITFVNTHVEKLPSSFDEKIFRGSEILILAFKKKEKIELASIEFHKQKKNIQKNISSGSVRSVSTSHTQSDINFIFKTKIKNNIRIKRNRLRLVILFFTLSVLFYLGFNIFILSNMNSEVFLTFTDFLQTKFSKLQSVFCQIFSITIFSLFNFEVNFPDLPDLRRFDMVDPSMYENLNKTNIYINAAYTSLEEELESFASSSNFYNVTSNTELVQQLFSQSFWKLDNKDYIASLFQFIVFYYSQLSKDIFFVREGADNSFFMQNFENVMKSLVSYEKLISSDISFLFEEFLKNLLIFSLVV